MVAGFQGEAFQEHENRSLLLLVSHLKTLWLKTKMIYYYHSMDQESGSGWDGSFFSSIWCQLSCIQLGWVQEVFILHVWHLRDSVLLCVAFILV